MPRDDAKFREIEVERLVLREPRESRVRAVLETLPLDHQAPLVRLSLLAPDGEPMMVAEIDEAGEPTIHVGHPDRGVTLVITPQAVDLWAGGNVVASVQSGEDGGKIELARRPSEHSEPPSFETEY